MAMLATDNTHGYIVSGGEDLLVHLWDLQGWFVNPFPYTELSLNLSWTLVNAKIAVVSSFTTTVCVCRHTPQDVKCHDPTHGGIVVTNWAEPAPPPGQHPIHHLVTPTPISNPHCPIIHQLTSLL